jgi:hypothetical protein
LSVASYCIGSDIRCSIGNVVTYRYLKWSNILFEYILKNEPGCAPIEEGGI